MMASIKLDGKRIFQGYMLQSPSQPLKGYRRVQECIIKKEGGNEIKTNN